MARVSNEQVNEYRQYSEVLSNAAGDAVRSALSDMNITNPNLRKLVVDTVIGNFSHFGSASAELGRVWYQQCRDIESDGSSYYVADSYVDDSLYGKLTNSIYASLDKANSASDDDAYDKWLKEYLAKTEGKSYADVDLDDFDKDDVIDDAAIDEIAESLANYVYKVNRDTVEANVDWENEGVKAGPNTPTRVEQRQELRRSPSGRVAYMRVPADDCACSFCIVMASRGAVYKSARTAGDDLDHKYHLNCRCSVVPVSVEDPFIEGYSTDSYEDMYYGAREKWEHDDYSADVAKRIERGRANAEANGTKWRDINEIEIVMRDMYELH